MSDSHILNGISTQSVGDLEEATTRCTIAQGRAEGQSQNDIVLDGDLACKLNNQVLVDAFFDGGAARDHGGDAGSGQGSRGDGHLGSVHHNARSALQDIHGNGDIASVS